MCRRHDGVVWCPTLPPTQNFLSKSWHDMREFSIEWPARFYDTSSGVAGISWLPFEFIDVNFRQKLGSEGNKLKTRWKTTRVILIRWGTAEISFQQSKWHAWFFETLSCAVSDVKLETLEYFLATRNDMREFTTRRGAWGKGTWVDFSILHIFSQYLACPGLCSGLCPGLCLGI